MTPPLATTWQATPAPTDRPIIIVANIHGKDGDDSYYSIPYVGQACWTTDTTGNGYWLTDEDGMAICRYQDETLRIHEWIDLPPIEAVAGNTLTTGEGFSATMQLTQQLSKTSR